MKLPGGRGLRRAQTAIVCVAVAWGFACAVAWALPTQAPKRLSSDVALTDDDGDAPLFPIPALSPGEAVSRCITLQYTAEAAGEVRMLVVGETNPAVSRQIGIQVETGTGGRFGDCSGFVGTAIYQGTLAEITEMGQDWTSALALMRPPSSQTTTLRITAGIGDSAQQGVNARASFAFTARSLNERVSTDPGSIVPVPTKTDKSDSSKGSGTPVIPPMTSTLDGATPTPTPSASNPTDGGASTLGRLDAGGDAPPRTSTGSDGPSTPAPASGLPQGGRNGDESLVTVPGPTGRVGGPSKKRPKPLGEAVAEQLGKVGEVVTRAAETVLVRSPFPLALGLLVFGFLGLQNRIDRRDPKLALAPVFGDPDVAFRDPDPSFHQPRRADDAMASLKVRDESSDSLV